MAEANLYSRFRRAASFIPTGVAVLQTAETNMTVSTLQCVSFDPPWVSVALSHIIAQSRCNPRSRAPGNPASFPNPNGPAERTLQPAPSTQCAIRGQNFEKMPEGIRRFNEAVGTPNTDDAGYHDTLTWFWANVISRVVADCNDEWQAAQRAVTLLGEDHDLHYLYYNFDVVGSVGARRKWIAPDLKGPW